ncbi:MAG: T9SS type A sorting domain-containing protein, partial [Elusimicrobia bacterium]|nr:T9SS type A sorting domain-containing protein [Elusimicrobiota bacterium]
SVPEAADDPEEVSARAGQARAQGLQALGPAVKYDGGGSRLLAPILVEMRAPAASPAGQAQTRSALIYAWQGETRSWEPLAAQVASADGRIRAQAGSWAVFGAFCAAPAADSLGGVGKVFVFPNPARRNLTFHVESGLAEWVEIRVYALTGALVYATTLTGGPNLVDRGDGPRSAYEHIWSLGGAASGTYYYTISVKQGGITTRRAGKFALIR